MSQNKAFRVTTAVVTDWLGKAPMLTFEDEPGTTHPIVVPTGDERPNRVGLAVDELLAELGLRRTNLFEEWSDGTRRVRVLNVAPWSAAAPTDVRADRRVPVQEIDGMHAVSRDGFVNERWSTTGLHRCERGEVVTVGGDRRPVVLLTEPEPVGDQWHQRLVGKAAVVDTGDVVDYDQPATASVLARCDVFFANEAGVSA